MKTRNSFIPKIQSVTVALLAAASLLVFGETASAGQAAPLRVETVYETQISWIPRVITNIIEVRIPTNLFINVYITNQIEAVRSNVINLYRTNWTDQTETRVVPVELTRTNFVTLYQTNLNILTFTNWETVLVMKTNRVTQRVPNVVEIDLPAGPAVAVKTPAGGTGIAGATTGSADGLTLEAATTGKALLGDLIEVQFKLKSANGAATRLASYEWRVERTDGSVLLFGQEPEFKRELPLGTYRIEVKTRAASNSPLVRVVRVVEVTDGEVIQQSASLGRSAN